MLGAPLAFSSGCGSSKKTKRSKAKPPLPPGELIGASHEIGHKLRSAISGAPPTDWHEHDVIIVGAGVAGLSAARQLAKEKIDDCLIVELEKSVGGTSRSSSSPLVGYPWGAHYITTPTIENQPLIELLNEMDVLDGIDEVGDAIPKDAYRCRKPEERLFLNGQWHKGIFPADGATKSDYLQYKRFESMIVEFGKRRDAKGRRAFVMPMALCAQDEDLLQLDKISMTQWLGNEGFDSERLKWYINYACRDDYGMSIDQTSAWAAIFYFAARNGAGGERPYITWPEGNGRLVAQIRKAVKAKIDTGRLVFRVGLQKGGKREVIAIDRDGKQVGLRARQVIFAAPHFLADNVIEDLQADDAASYIDDFHYAAWAVVNMELKRLPETKGQTMAWDNVIHGSRSLGYVCATYQKGIDDGRQHITYYYPVMNDDVAQARERLLSIDRDGWVDIALTDIEQAHPDIRDIVVRADVARWGHGMIQPRIGFVSGNSRKGALKQWPGLVFAHSDQSGLGLFEEAFYRGTEAGKLVAKAIA